MVLCRWLAAASLFAVFLLNSPVSLAAGGGKKRRNGKVTTTVSEELAPSAPQEGDMREAAPSGPERATRQKALRPEKSTKVKSSKLRQTLEMKLSEAQEKLAAATVDFEGDVAPRSPAAAGSRPAGGRGAEPGADAPAPTESMCATAQEQSIETVEGGGTEAGAGRTPSVAAGRRDDGSRGGEGAATGETEGLPRVRQFPGAPISLVQEGQGHTAPPSAPPSAEDIAAHNARVLVRRAVLVEDLADAMRTFCKIYDVRGGGDFNEARQHLQQACNLLAAMKITESSVWNAAAAEALHLGQTTLFALNARDPSLIKGIVPQPPSFTQIVKTRPAARVEAAENAVDEFVQQVATPWYERYVQCVGGPPGAMRRVLEELKAAEVHLLGLKKRYFDVWYFYLEYVLVWLTVKLAKVEAEVEHQARAELEHEEAGAAANK